MKSTTPTSHRVLALIGALILAGLYVTTLILAVTGNEHTMGMLTASLFASIVVPVFLYVARMVTKGLKDRNSDKS
ncbi:MAG TPA: hypothetical protein IAA04_07010 [Candidatus Lachnoclostridium pullistercoris]|uniref:Uncharacterized protein n=1 Tax=Candidatus Lachnoclostridium pullistercoris TaxID=2838632 RepID=A0A9D2PD11_9FIRM|nr:hypothetical protein [Candidatus Lachnoclostridium pullistercoris]